MKINENQRIGVHGSMLEAVQDAFALAANEGISHLSIRNEERSGRKILIDNKSTLNFSSCSYLGLELDERLKKGAIDAVEKYGVQYSCSKTYTSVGLYKELEELTSLIFKAHVVIAPSTSLAHVSTFGVIIEDNDAVIIDHQAHASIQNGLKLIRGANVSIEVVRHNNLKALEERIIELSKTNNKIWYCIDGVYSMYGDYAPLKGIERLLNKYEQLHLYCDDAHGMSWTGENGSGYALSQIDLHERMVLVTSLNKSFATGGGIVVSKNKALIDRVKFCGSSMIFSGPIPPPMLGAAVASAKIHLSREMEFLQNQLYERRSFTMNTLKQYNLIAPEITDSPISFVGIGGDDIGIGVGIVKKLIDEGFYLNLSTFPAVPKKNTGLRFTVTNHHSLDDIHNLVQAMAYHINKAWEDFEVPINKVCKAFKLKKGYEGIKLP